MLETSIKLPFLQISPKVWTTKDKLFAKTSIVYRILNLFFYSRLVIINRKTKEVQIIKKTFWLIFDKNTIKFQDIKYIDRSHYETPSTIGITADGLGSHDVEEIFYIQLVLNSTCQPVNLFRFIGDGVRYTGVIGVLIGGDSFIDFQGKQNEKSISYAQLVSKYIGVPLWFERKIMPTPTIKKFCCSKCQRTFAKYCSNCIYCGNDKILKS